MLNKLASFDILELNRLCLKDNIKNLASFLVGKALRLLPRPLVVISYADSGWNHNGYIYQATNWIYKGMSKGKRNIRIDGHLYHQKSAFNAFGTASEGKLQLMFPEKSVTVEYQGDKHRYFYLLGSKKQKRDMKELLDGKWATEPYPKGENKYY